MATGWRTARVFISSTFRDMQAERDHLVRVVFPELRERLHPHRVYLEDIDLRWGITKEQTENAQTLDLCLQKIDECRPLFLGLLGERYGTLIQATPNALVARGLGAHADRSVTELEILYGALQPNRSARAVFLLRNPAALDAVPATLRRAVFEDGDAQARVKLADLKRRIRGSGHPVAEYTAQWTTRSGNATDGALGGLDQFGVQVRDLLWNALGEELGLNAEGEARQVPNTLEEERALHERFMEDRLRIFVGRRPALDALLAYAASDDRRACFVSGPVGSGKSALLAMCLTELRALNPSTAVVGHFAGASARSGDLTGLLTRLCQELESFAGDAASSGSTGLEAAPATVLRTRFADVLARLDGGRRVVLVVDGIDQVEGAAGSYGLDWLPTTLPPGVKFITSAASDAERGRAVREAFAHRDYVAATVGPLTDAERIEIIHQVPALWAKTLDARQIRFLLACPATANPLYLRVALEELRGFGSYSRLTDKIRALPWARSKAGRAWFRWHAPDVDYLESTYLLFVEIVKRLESEFDAKAVRSALTGLASARRGLSERELRELTGNQDVFAILRLVRPYVISRDGLVKFYHGEFESAVARYYLAGRDDRRAVHHTLAEYFAAQSWWVSSGGDVVANARKCDELPWHRTLSASGPGPAALLMEPDFLEAKAAAGLIEDLPEDFAHLLRLRTGVRVTEVMDAKDRRRWRRLGGAERVDDDESIGFPRKRLQAIEEALRRDMKFLRDHPDKLFQSLWNLAWWRDCEELRPHVVRPDLIARDVGLAAWLEAWRARRSSGGARRPWLRALRPPAPPLGNAIRTMFHGSEIAALATLGNSRRVATGGGSAVRIWDVDTGQEIRTLRIAESRSVSEALAAVLEGRDVSEDDARANLCGLACAPDGKRLAVGYGRNVRIYDTESGEILHRLRCELDKLTVAFSPDGKTLAAGDGSASVYLWDVDSGVLRRRLENDGNVLAVGFLGAETLWARVMIVHEPVDDQALPTYESEIVWWDAGAGRVMERMKGIEVCEVSGDRQTFMLAIPGRAVEDGGSNIFVYRLGAKSKTWDARRPANIFLPDGAVALAFDGSKIASAPAGDSEHVVNIVGTASAGAWPQLRCHGEEITALAFLPTFDENRLREAHDRGANVVADQMLQYSAAHAKAKLSPSIDARRHLPEWLFPEQIASSSTDGTLCISSTDSSPPRSSWPLRHKQKISEAMFSPDGNTFATITLDSIRLWDGESGLARAEIARGSRVIAFSTDSAMISSVSGDGTKVMSWHTSDGSRTGEWHSGQRVACIAYLPTGELLVGCEDGEAFVCDPMNGTVRTKLAALGATPTCVDIDLDGELAAFVDVKHDVHVVDMVTLTEVARFSAVREPKRHNPEIRNVRVIGGAIVLFNAAYECSMWDQHGAPLRQTDLVYDPDGFISGAGRQLARLCFSAGQAVLNIVDGSTGTIVAAAPIQLHSGEGFCVRAHPSGVIFAVTSGRDFWLFRLEGAADLREYGHGHKLQ